MKIETNRLTGVELDWAVAKCEGYVAGPSGSYWINEDECVDFRPSTNWGQGGPIIEREKIGLEWTGDWFADIFIEAEGKHLITHGPTPLIAAMRCYVASKLGEEVEVHDALGV